MSGVSNSNDILKQAEIRTLLAVAVLNAMELRATPNRIHAITGIDLRYLRNLLRQLSTKGLLKSFTPSGFGFLGTPESSKIYILAKDLDKILDEHPEIIEWTSTLPEEDLRASSKEELLRKVKNIKHTKLGIEIMKRLGIVGTPYYVDIEGG